MSAYRCVPLGVSVSWWGFCFFVESGWVIGQLGVFPHFHCGCLCMNISVISVCMSQGENVGVQLCPMDPYRSVCVCVPVCEHTYIFVHLVDYFLRVGFPKSKIWPFCKTFFFFWSKFFLAYLTPPEQRLGMRPQLHPELQMGLSHNSVGNLLPYLAYTAQYVIFCPQFGEKRTSLRSFLGMCTQCKN